MTAITLSNRPVYTLSEINKISHSISTNHQLLEVEKQIASIEGGVNALAKKTFRSARFSLIKNLLPKGGTVLSFQSKREWLEDAAIFQRKSVSIIYTENYSADDWESILTNAIDVVYISTIQQQTLNVQDYGYIIQKAHSLNIPVVFDNTFGGLGHIYSPLKDGADFVLIDTSSIELFSKHRVHAFIVEGENGILHSNKDKVLGKTVLGVQKNNRILHTKWTYLFADKEDYLEKLVKKASRKFGDYSRTANYVARWLNNQEDIMEINYPGLKSAESHIHAELYFKGGYGYTFKFSLWDNDYSYSLLKGLFRSGNVNGVQVEVDSERKEFFIQIRTEDYTRVLNYFQKVFSILKGSVEFKQNITKENKLKQVFDFELKQLLTANATTYKRRN
jgi:hypothetical protein